MISLGIDLVAGKNLVPIPATGNTALVTLRFMNAPVFFSAQPAPRKHFTRARTQGKVDPGDLWIGLMGVNPKAGLSPFCDIIVSITEAFGH
jgi:hypothetical protein